MQGAIKILSLILLFNNLSFAQIIKSDTLGIDQFNVSNYLTAELDPFYNASQAKNITSFGSGQVITTAERSMLSDAILSSNVLSTIIDASVAVVSSNAIFDALALKADVSAVAANTTKRSYPSADSTKLAGIEVGAEVNVQADWTETNTGSDAFILNRPLEIIFQNGAYYVKDQVGALAFLYQEPIYVTRENLFFTTSTAFQDIINETVSLPAGDYEILLTAQGNGDATNSDFWIDFIIDGSSASSQSQTIHRQEPKDVGGNSTTPYSNQALPVLYRGIKTFTAGNHSFNPRIKSEASGAEAGVWNFILSIKRIDGQIINN